MRRNGLRVIAVVLMVGMLGVGFAQPAEQPEREGRGEGRQRVAALTEEQHEQMDELRMNHLKKTMPMQTDLQIKEMELAALWRAEELSSKAIVGKVKEISALRGKLQLERVNHKLAMYNILTPEQRQRAHRFLGRGHGRKGRRGMRRGMGMRGMGRHGFGRRGRGFNMMPGLPMPE